MGKDLIACPVAGCMKRCQTHDSLFGHLYYVHRKADLIRALFKALGYPTQAHHRLPNGKIALSK